jgi:hypothetical protein
MQGNHKQEKKHLQLRQRQCGSAEQSKPAVAILPDSAQHPFPPVKTVDGYLFT